TAAACFPATVTGVSTLDGRVELIADAGTITIGASGVAGSGVAVGNGLVLIEATTGGVMQTAEGAIVGATLAIRAGDAVILVAAANDVDTAAVNTSGLIELSDIDDLTVGTATVGVPGLFFGGTVTGLTSGGGDINVQTGFVLFLSDGIDAGAGDVRLVVSGTIAQSSSGAVVADELGIVAAGAVTLFAAANDVNTFAVSATGLVEFRDADDLTIGAVAASGDCGFTGAVGITSGDGDVDLGTGSLLDIQQAIDAGAGTIRLLVTGGGSPSVVQAATGVLTASALSVQAPNFIDLDNAANTIGVLAASSGTGGVHFHNATGFTVGA